MKIRRQIANIVTTMICVTGICGFSYENISAATGTYGNLTYNTVDSDGDGTDDCIEITECEENVTAVDIPAEINGLPVYKICKYTFYECQAKEINIPESITELEEPVFNAKNLESINVSAENMNFCSSDGILFNKNFTKLINYPSAKAQAEYTVIDSVTEINAYAFNNCVNLTEITIPENVLTIGDYAFSGCNNLESITVTENNANYVSENGILYNKSYTELIRYPSGKTQSACTVKDSVKSLAMGAFSNSSNLTYVKLPEGLTEIGDFAFAICDNLKNITLPDSLTNLGYFAFSNCGNLSQITIPENINNIGQCTFWYCTNMKSITIENPDCVIYDSYDTISSDYDTINHKYIFDGIIYGCENSTAQEYAKKYNIKFALIGTEYTPLKGDISGNGAVDLYDAIEICKNIMCMRTFTESEKDIADYNDDGTVDLYDAIEIARALLP